MEITAGESLLVIGLVGVGVVAIAGGRRWLRRLGYVIILGAMVVASILFALFGVFHYGTLS
jgi:hypothetical protein